MDRRLISSLAAAVAAPLLFLGAAGLYADREILDRGAFTDRASSALDHEPVREVVAEQLAIALVEQGSKDLLAVRPLLPPAVEAVVASRPFAELFEVAVADLHGLMLGERETGVVLALDEAATLLIEGLRSLSPEIAGELPSRVDPSLASLGAEDFEVGLVRTLEDVASAATPLLLASAALLLVALWFSDSRRRGLARVGLSLAGVGLTLWGAVEVGRIVTTRRAADLGGIDEEQAREALASVWGSFFGDLQTWSLAGAAIGLACVGAGSAVGSPDQWLAHAGSRVRALASSRSPRLRTLRGLAAIGAGVLLITQPESFVRTLVVAIGGISVLLGVGELAAAADASGKERPLPARAAALRLAAVVAGVTAAAGLAVLIAVPTKPRAERLEAEAPDGCNGSRELCDRRLSEVVFATTHNSFSAAERDGWLFANQRYGIDRQLADGVRAFMLDPHFGYRQPNGRVRTDLEAEGTNRNRVARRLGRRATIAAERVAGGVGLGEARGQRGIFLCHTLCELGAEPLVDELEVLHSFLEEHDDEVVVLFIEPYVPVRELEQAFEEADLRDWLAEFDRSQPLPTLGELVDAGRRVVVFTERGGGSRPWYHPMFSYVQDTPIAESAAEFRCRGGRGGVSSPLLVLNHWIDRFPPPAGANALASEESRLKERIRRCTAARGVRPNFIAVDFYDLGDTVEVVRELASDTRLPPWPR